MIVGVGLEPERVMRCVDTALHRRCDNCPHSGFTASRRNGPRHLLDRGYPQEEIRQLLGVPDKHTIVMLMTVGYPAEEPAQSRAFPLLKLSRMTSSRQGGCAEMDAMSVVSGLWGIVVQYAGRLILAAVVFFGGRQLVNLAINLTERRMAR